MEIKEIVKELIKIAKIKGNPQEPFICCDIVGQDELFTIQEKLMNLIDKLDHITAIKELPYMYQEVKQ